MIEHLSAEEISQWMIGDRTPRLEVHVAECTACREELAELESTLSQFRGAVREWGADEPAPAWREPAAPGAWFSWPRLACATALVLLMTAAPVYWTARARERAAAEARADAQLLEQVDSSISRAVPESMEPLVNLATWNSSEVKQTLERQ